MEGTYDDRDYIPGILRMGLSGIQLLLYPRIYHEVAPKLAEFLQEDEEKRARFESVYSGNVFDENGKITEEACYSYI